MFIQQVASNLVERYGLPAVFVAVVHNGTSFTTGLRSTTRTEYMIPKAIRLTKNQNQNLISQIAGNFKTTGDYTEYSLRLLLKGNALPVEPKPSVDYVILDNKKYNIVKIERIDVQECVMLKLLATDEYPGRVFTVTVKQRLKMNGDPEHEL
jgi:hypothetical protein